MHVDRPYAVAGDVLRVTVSDEEGGWPEPCDVVDTPAGRFLGRVGPGTPAVFQVPVPPTREPIERFPLSATLTQSMWVTTAVAEVWVGRTSTLVDLLAAAEHGTAGESLAVTVRASDLSGAAAPGDVRLSVRGTDGNEPKGGARWTGTARVDATGSKAMQVPLAGSGPRWDSRRGGGQALAHLVVWARPRPPELSGRGPLAVQPASTHARPGEPLDVAVRLPAGRGQAWVTLEQGSVWTERTLAPAPGRTVHVALPVADGARGLAKVVVTHVAGGAVTTASATVEVQTSEAMTVRATTDRRVYAQAGARPRCTWSRGAATARRPRGWPRLGSPTPATGRPARTTIRCRAST